MGRGGPFLWAAAIAVAWRLVQVAGETGTNTALDPVSLKLGPGSHRAATALEAVDPKIRPVRVLIASGIEAVRISSDGPLAASASRSLRLPVASVLTIARTNGGLQLDDGAARYRFVDVTAKSTDGTLSVCFQRGGQWSGETIYPGTLRALIDEQEEMDVLNFVEPEVYVASVVVGEVWPNFAVEAMRAQAIASRTFVLYQMSRNSNLPYDVTATQGSQVYKGKREDAVGQASRQAAEYTRGVVLTYNDGQNDRIFCAYYSAACGGMSQAAAELGAEGNVPPLAGGVRCNYCRIAPGDAYRWGPVRIPASEVLEKLQGRYPEVAELGSLIAVTVTNRTPSGRQVTLRLKGSTGQSFDILAERFRLALGGSVIKSTDCQIRVSGGEVIFENGKGYGHGLGLCQWGMQSQALQGKSAAEILRYYYPGSKLSRAY